MGDRCFSLQAKQIKQVSGRAVRAIGAFRCRCLSEHLSELLHCLLLVVAELVPACALLLDLTLDLQKGESNTDQNALPMHTANSTPVRATHADVAA